MTLEEKTKEINKLHKLLDIADSFYIKCEIKEDKLRYIIYGVMGAYSNLFQMYENNECKTLDALFDAYLNVLEEKRSRKIKDYEKAIKKLEVK